MQRLRPWFVLLAPALLIVGCERSRVVPPADSMRPVAGATTQLVPSANAAGWDAELGPMLLVGMELPENGGVVTADSAGDAASSLGGARVRLLGRDGSSQLATLTSSDTAVDNSCAGLAVWHLHAAEGSLAAWAVGFAADEKIEPIAMDSMEEMTSADSASAAAQVTRLASMIPEGGSQRFSGIPFTVQSLWRFSPAPGVRVIAANVIRTVNVEANPLEERTLIIAERDSGAASYEIVFHERSQGSEETVESREIVSALRLGASATPTLLIGRDFDTSTTYSLLEREGGGKWRQRWTSRRVRC